MGPTSFELVPGARRRLSQVESFVEAQLDLGAREVWVVAPSRRAGRRLLRALTIRRGRLAWVRAFTLRELAEELALPGLVAEGLAALPPLGARALTASALARHAEHMPTLGPQAVQYQGLRRLLSETLLELRANAVSPQELRDLAGREGCSGRETELAGLLEAFEAALDEGNYADEADLFVLATERLSAGTPARPLAVLDPAPGSTETARFLAALADWASPALIVSAPGAQPFLQRLAQAGLSAPVTPELPPATTALARAQRDLFTPRPESRAPDASLTARSEPEAAAEAAEIVRQIDALGRQGVAYDQVAVLLPAPQPYLALFQEAFARAELPAYLVPGPPVPEPAGRTLRILLRVALEHGSVRRLLEALSLGELKTLTAGTSAPRLERLLVEAAVVSGDPARWTRRLSGLRRKLEASRREAEREPESPALARVRADLLGVDALLERGVALVTELERLRDARLGWGEWSRRLIDLAERQLTAPPALLERLRELGSLDGLGVVDLAGVLDLLDQRLGLSHDPPGEPEGRVLVAPIHAARGCSFPHVFVPGWVEGTFPARVHEDPILFDATREALRGPEFRARERDRLDERDRLRIALDAAETHLVLTFPRLDPSEGREPVPSSYLFDLLEAGEGWRDGLEALRRRAIDPTGARLDHPVPLDPARAAAPGEFDLAVALRCGAVPHLEGLDAEHEPGLDSCRRARARGELLRQPRLTSADGLIDPPPALAEAIRARSLVRSPVSATGLERFASCPYAFFLSRVVRLRELDEPEPLPELDPLTRGNLIHQTVHSFLIDLGLPAQLRSSQLDALLPRLDQAFDATASALQDEHGIERPLLLDAALAAARRDLRRWLRARAEEGDQGWRIVASELAFGLGDHVASDPASQKDPVTLPGETAVILRGQIDVVEDHPTRGLRRITDLKGGRRRVEQDDRLLGGQSLQRPLYALAYAQLRGEAPGAQPTLARLSYVGAEPADVEVTVDADLIRHTQRALAHVERAFEQACFPAVPAPNLQDWRRSTKSDALAVPPSCPSFCPYLSVCGQGADRRAARKLSDSRLRTVRSIRRQP